MTTGELKTERTQLMFAPSELKQIDDWGFSRRIRSRAEAIRQLIEKGLEAAKAEGKVGGGDRSGN